MAEQSKPQPSVSEIMEKATKKALSGGLAGMGAQAINVLALMWMRTIMNYQYRFGWSLRPLILEAISAMFEAFKGLFPNGSA